ncbi:MAG: hypothetical protein JRJ58_10570 [Deltaproteobacteria bacterium]|nr:hypothetical protein [Deltaproteobacteria bacterium]
MRLKSRGLGRKELVLDFREYAVIREEDEVIIVGTIRDPVNWDFSIRMCEDDVVGMSKLILCRPMIGILLRSFFKRRKQHHWTQEQSEHIAEGRQRLVNAWQKADERTRTWEETRSERAQITGESN